MMTSSICSGLRPVRSSRFLTTAAPSLDAGMPAKVPPKLPTAVRAAATITTSSLFMNSSG